MRLYKIIGLLCLISVLHSCKKDLTDDFDPIIGRWKWYRTVKNQEDIFTGNVVYTDPYAWAANSTDQYEIEFKKKGLVLMYKNGEVERKYKVKNSKGTKGHTLGTVWRYTLEFRKDENMNVKYYADYDTLVLFHFPYSASDNSDFYYGNQFIRE